MVKEAFGARTYLVGQIPGALVRNCSDAEIKAYKEDIVRSAIELADLTIHKMSQQIIHPWEQADAAVPGTTSDQDEAAL